MAYGMIADSNPQSVFGRGGNELLWESVQDHAPVTAEVADQVSTVRCCASKVQFSRGSIRSFQTILCFLFCGRDPCVLFVRQHAIQGFE